MNRNRDKKNRKLEKVLFKIANLEGKRDNPLLNVVVGKICPMLWRGFFYNALFCSLEYSQ